MNKKNNVFNTGLGVKCPACSGRGSKGSCEDHVALCPSSQESQQRGANILFHQVLGGDKECAEHGKSTGVSTKFYPGAHVCVDCVIEDRERLANDHARLLVAIGRLKGEIGAAQDHIDRASGIVKEALNK